MTPISIENVSKVYPDGTHAVRDVSLEVPDGQCMVLVGPSGCGKTTLLRMIAGLEAVTAGTLRIGDTIVNAVPPQDRNIAMVFQSYALYPHMTVYDNMAYALKRRRMTKHEVDARVRSTAETLELSGVLGKKPAALSGGQRQRVAMGRAIVREPAAFLMDEPLSNLDAKLRTQMRAEIARIRAELGITTVYVTHDQIEALTLGDVVAVMDGGTVQQVSDPQSIYREPKNLFVASFIGSPAMNTVMATMEATEDGMFVVFGDHRLRIPAGTLQRMPQLHGYRGSPVVLGIRPEDVGLLEGSEVDRDGVLTARLELSEMLGGVVDLHFSIATQEVIADPERRDEATVADGHRSTIAPRARFTARIAAGSTPRDWRVGEPVDLLVDTTALHFFDPESGSSLAARYAATSSSR